ncbi:MAG: hypothetical protein ABI042_00640 [Verrucomicrobiota bacterium]
MELIPYKEFGKLRLKPFLAKDADVDEMEDTEWMGGVWISEMVGITAFRRLETTPNEMGGLEIVFSEISEKETLAILNAIRLPLRPDMTLEEVRLVLGEPEKIEVLRTVEWKNYEFTIGSQYPYYLSCSIYNTGGMMGLEVIRKDMLSRIEADKG